MAKQKKIKGLWIPLEILNSKELRQELTILHMAIFAVIDNLDGDKGCFASNGYIADSCNCSNRSVSRVVSKLVHLGYVKRVSFDGRVRTLKVIGFGTVPTPDELLVPPEPPPSLPEPTCPSADLSVPDLSVQEKHNESDYDEHLQFIAGACDYEFTNTEMQMLSKEIPSFNEPNRDLQRCDFLRTMYLRLQRRAEDKTKGKVPHRFNYLLTIIKKEVQEKQLE